MAKMEEMMATMQKENEELRQTIQAAGKEAETKGDKGSDNGEPDNRI